MTLGPDTCMIHIKRVLKTTKPGRKIKAIVFRRCRNSALCIVEHVQWYCTLKVPFRPCPVKGQLLISYRNLHGPVSVDTVSCWIKGSLVTAGIDTTVLRAHCTRSVSTSAAARQGDPLDIIMQAANWQSAETFAKFYHQTTSSHGHGSGFMEAVFGSAK